MNDTNDTNPNVTIIIPIRNEADFIERSLSAVLAQDYPADRMEVLVVDGMSTDGTRELVRDLFERAHASTFKQPAPSGAWGSNAPTACPGRSVGFQRANLRLLDNPHQIVPAAMNVGIRAAQGDVIVRVDGHCEIPPHYVRTCVAALEETGAENVGGRVCSINKTYLGQTIALAVSTPLFIGNSHFRYSDQKGYVDTVPFGAYPREVFNRIGLFDEELVRHQDYELNCRLRNAGGKILYLPDLEVKYFPRSSWWKFARQYFQYGFWKVRVMQKTADAFRIRHFAPTLLAMFALGGLFLSLVLPFMWFRLLYAAGMLLYVTAALAASLYVAARRGCWQYLPVLPLIFATIHLSWGAGFWWGVLRWNLFPPDSSKSTFDSNAKRANSPQRTQRSQRKS